MLPASQDSSWLSGPSQSPVLGKGSCRMGAFLGSPLFGSQGFSAQVSLRVGARLFRVLAGPHSWGPGSQEGLHHSTWLTPGPCKVEAIVLIQVPAPI